MLIERRGQATVEHAAKSRKSMTDFGVPAAHADWVSPKPVDEAVYFAMLDAVLAAGADPNTPWDNGLTLLMRGGVETAERLLKHGADIRRRDSTGCMAIHYAENPAVVRLLAANGADVNVLVAPPANSISYPYTPLQGHLWSQAWKPKPADRDPARTWRGP